MNKMEHKPTRRTIERTILFALAMLNQIMSAAGKPLVPISGGLETIITTALTVAVSIRCFWKNNSFTSEAVRADEYMNRLKSWRR